MTAALSHLAAARTADRPAYAPPPVGPARTHEAVADLLTDDTARRDRVVGRYAAMLHPHLRGPGRVPARQL